MVITLEEGSINPVIDKETILNGNDMIGFPFSEKNKSIQYPDISIGNYNYESNYQEVRDLATRKVKEMLKDSVNISSDKVSIKSMMRVMENNLIGSSTTIVCVVNMINVEGEVHQNTINLIGDYDV